MRENQSTVKVKSPYFQKGFEAAIDNKGVRPENPYLKSAGEEWEKGFKDGLVVLEELRTNY